MKIELDDAREQNAALMEVIAGKLTQAILAEGRTPDRDTLSHTTAGAIVLRVLLEKDFQRTAYLMLACALVDKVLEEREAAA